MSNLPRIYFYLTIAVTLILAISLSASAQDSNRGSGGTNSGASVTYEDFTKIKSKCSTRTVHRQIVKVHSKCHVIVNSKRCKGHCRSLTDFQLDPPYLTRDCACCKPFGDVTYKVEELDCQVITSEGQPQPTGEKVKISVPHDMNCQCVRCSRLING